MWDHQTVTGNRKWCMRQANHRIIGRAKLSDRLMFEIKKVFSNSDFYADTVTQLFFTATMPLRKEVDPEKTVAAASGVFRDVCSEKPPYHTAEELWEGLKQGDEGARLLFVFFLRLRKDERTRCSVEKAIAAEGKRWVGVLIEDAWRLDLLLGHRAVPYQGKPKSVVAVKGSRAQRRILARSGLARYSAPSLKERAAVRLQTTWDKIHQQWVVLWMDNWYNKQFTTNPDKNDKSLNATALVVLLLKDAPRYWHGILAWKTLNGVFLL